MLLAFEVLACTTCEWLYKHSYISEICLSEHDASQVKSCYNLLRLGTVIVLVSSGTDFVNTPCLYSVRATR